MTKYVVLEELKDNRSVPEPKCLQKNYLVQSIDRSKVKIFSEGHKKMRKNIGMVFC